MSILRIIKLVSDYSFETAKREVIKTRDVRGNKFIRELRDFARECWVPDLMEEVIAEIDDKPVDSVFAFPYDIEDTMNEIIYNLYNLETDMWYPTTNTLRYYIRNYGSYLDLLWDRAVELDLEDDLIVLLKKWCSNYVTPVQRVTSEAFASQIFIKLRENRLDEAVDDLKVYIKYRLPEEELVLLSKAKQYGFNQATVNSLKRQIIIKSRDRLEKRIMSVLNITGDSARVVESMS